MMKYFVVAVLFFTIAVSCLHAQSGKIPLSERNALLQIYKSMQGEQWRYKKGWNGEHGTEHTWHGVTVEKINGAMHVVRLVIGEDLFKYRSNLVAGRLPSSIGNLRFLRHLIIRGSKIEGQLPKELFGLENLEYLDIAFNDISGDVPTALFSMKNLKYLDMRYTGFTGSLPSEITAPLWYCNVSGTKINGTIPGISRIRWFLCDETSIDATQQKMPDTRGEAADSVVYYSTVDNLRIRTTPDLKGEIAGKLSKYDLSEYLWETTETVTQLVVDGKNVSSPWHRVRTLDGTIGWVWGGFMQELKRSRVSYLFTGDNEAYLLKIASEIEIIDSKGSIQTRHTNRNINLYLGETYQIRFSVINQTRESFSGLIYLVARASIQNTTEYVNEGVRLVLGKNEKKEIILSYTHKNEQNRLYFMCRESNVDFILCSIDNYSNGVFVSTFLH